MDPIGLQKQVRDNAEDFQNCLKDLKNWELDMKRKENELSINNSSSPGQGLGLPANQAGGMPPVRNKRRKTEKNMRGGRPSSPRSTLREKPQAKDGIDYSSWKKFTVNKAFLQEEDYSPEEGDEDIESEEEDEETLRLHGQALYEKEKGNQFVKAQQWTNAIECYSRAIECYPYDAVFFANRALCYLKTSDFKACVIDCTSAIGMDITYVKAFQRRAAARMELGLLEAAKSDLEKVIQFEPKNTTSLAELAKIEKKITEMQNQKQNLISQEKTAVAGKNIASLSPDARASTASTSSSMELFEEVNASQDKNICLIGQEKQKNEENSDASFDINTNAASTSSSMVVKTIYKPPHLRSKKPMKEIDIKIINSGMTKKSIDLNDFKAHPKVLEVETTPSKVIDTVEKKTEAAEPCTVASNSVVKEKKPPILPCRMKPKEDISETPPPPKSYIDFFLAWKKINHSPKQRFLYLKQTPGRELSKIFQESLESSTFSELIETLETSFLPSKEPVYSYLLGMSKVERLSTLTMFMSNIDKARMKKLVESCECLGECNKEEGKILREKYEL